MKKTISRLLFWGISLIFMPVTASGPTEWLNDFNKCYAEESLQPKEFVLAKVQKKCEQDIVAKYKIKGNDVKFFVNVAKETTLSRVSEITLIYKGISQNPITSITGGGASCGLKSKPAETQLKSSGSAVVDILNIHPDSIDDIFCDVSPQKYFKTFGFIEVEGECRRICPKGKILWTIAYPTKHQCKTCEEVEAQLGENLPYPKGIYLKTEDKSNTCVDQKGCLPGHESFADLCMKICETGEKRDPQSGACKQVDSYCRDRFDQLMNSKAKSPYLLEARSIPETICGNFRLADFYRNAIQKTDTRVQGDLNHCESNDIPIGHRYIIDDWNQALMGQLVFEESPSLPDENECIRSAVKSLNPVVSGMAYIQMTFYGGGYGYGGYGIGPYGGSLGYGGYGYGSMGGGFGMGMSAPSGR